MSKARTTLPGWTERHGLDATETYARILVTKSTGTAHVSAGTGDNHFSHWFRNQDAVTACDRQLESGSWFSPGSYDATDVRTVLLNTLELPASDVSFKRICKACRKVTIEITGIDLMSEVN